MREQDDGSEVASPAGYINMDRHHTRVLPGYVEGTRMTFRTLPSQKSTLRAALAARIAVIDPTLGAVASASVAKPSLACCARYRAWTMAS